METENKTFAKCRAPLRQVKPLTFLSNHTHCLYHDDISQRSEGGVMLLRTSVWKTVNSNVLLPLAYISPSYIREEQRTLAAIQFMKPVQRPSWQKFPPLPYIRIFSSSSFSLPPNAKRVSPLLKFTFLLSLPVRPSVLLFPPKIEHIPSLSPSPLPSIPKWHLWFRSLGGPFPTDDNFEIFRFYPLVRSKSWGGDTGFAERPEIKTPKVRRGRERERERERERDRQRSEWSVETDASANAR